MIRFRCDCGCGREDTGKYEGFGGYRLPEGWHVAFAGKHRFEVAGARCELLVRNDVERKSRQVDLPLGDCKE